MLTVDELVKMMSCDRRLGRQGQSCLCVCVYACVCVRVCV
jgi:hypothetical protein